MSVYRCPKCNEIHNPLRMCKTELEDTLKTEKMNAKYGAERAFSNPLMNVDKSDLTR